MLRIKVIAILAVLICGSNSSTLKGLEGSDSSIIDIDTTEAPPLTITELSTEDLPTESSEEKPISNESNSAGLTEPAEIDDGLYFRLMMTVKQNWTEDFLDRKSESFVSLSKGLGSELIDLIDNSKEAKEPNMTIFKLVDVQPSQQSQENIYVTFVVSAKKEISGEDLSNAVQNQISIYGAIYNYEATKEKFVVEKITDEEAKEMEKEPIACTSGKMKL